jgi:hypothetical protein
VKALQLEDERQNMKSRSALYWKITILSLFLIAPTFNSYASETIYHYGDGTSGTTPPTPAQAAVGGFAVVNPETGVVHGVIVGSIDYFGGNNRTMGHEYMGCPAGCLIIQQSTSDQNGNVAGIHGPNVTYNENRNVFQVAESNTTQSQTVTESASNTSVVETQVSVSRSVRNYEFGVQDFTNTNGQFQMTEVAPAQDTTAQVAATTKEYACEESALICSAKSSTASTTLVDESVTFSERSTADQVQEKVISEAKNKIREHLSLILSMLERWLIE